MTPEELRYTKTHEWVDLGTDSSGAKIATMGLTDFALKALTDLVFIELPDVGREVEAEESFGEIESVTLLGHRGTIEWEHHGDGLRVQFPQKKPCEFAYCLKIHLPKK